MPFDPHEPSPIPGQSDSAWPTIDQLAAIGSVVVAWSWLQLGIEHLMATLVQGDDMLVQALTEDLSPDNRLVALKRLMTTWERAAPNLSDEHRVAITAGRDVVKWVAANKGKRNKIAHWIWARFDDEQLFGWKHHTMPREKGKDGPHEKMTKAELRDFARDIGDQEGRVAEVQRVLKTLPAWPSAPSSRETPPVPGLESLLSPYRRREWP